MGEVRALRATVATARRGEPVELAAPPLAVRQRIADQLGVADQPPAARPEVVVPLRSSPWRRPLLAAAAVLAVAAAATAVLVACVAGARGASRGDGAARRAERWLRLRPVVLADRRGQRSLLVDTTGLADGSYGVWLLDLQRSRTVALGVLDDSGRGRLTVPDGVRVGD